MMNGKLVAAMIGAATVGLATAVGIILSLESPTATPTEVSEDRPQETVTLTVSVGGGKDTTIVYSCPNPEGDMDACSASIPANDVVWSKKITVPVGATVRVQASGTIPVSCVIADESDRQVLDEQRGADARCSATAG